MQLSLSEDQSAILDALDSLIRPYVSMPVDCRDFFLTSPALDRELSEGGFLDVAFDPELGPVSAALIVEKLIRLPYASEVAASALVRPLLGELPGPICLVEADRIERPVRFLRSGATVVVLGEASVTSFTATEADVRPVDALYAYPVAMLAARQDRDIQAHDISPDALRTRWRIALAIEIAGLLAAAIDSTVLYVSERKQFGRPLGTFQAIRHRLAEASVRATGTRWLALKAAHGEDPGDAAIAAYYAQDAATQTIYDLHQFLGAMGMTLEHPLHLWTYRLKGLVSELGGAGAQAAAAAELVWSEVA